MYFIHPQSEVVIERQLNFNKQWDRRRILHNRFAGSLYIAKGACLRVGAFDIYAGGRITVNAGAKLTIGSGYLNNNSVITCFDSITIGNRVAISERVVMRDSDNHKVKAVGDMDSEQVNSAPIVIEDHVWIGMNVTILKGVTIGEGAIIAAGSVVTRDIPAHCMAAGVPARVIKNDVTWY